MPYKTFSGSQHLDKIIEINQKPIGRTSRSIPATYVGVFNLIRELFSSLTEAKVRGYTPGHFSFNVQRGRCEKCAGSGELNVKFKFMVSAPVACDECSGLAL